ncbi:hypothetical protein FHS35_005565 [Streptomyces umbrinus]|jgi:hypothetical protein|uniref:hypothetical protein n=1 Tax=Streptomyces umbrinus TaxID=67370 RepID=UPI00167ECA34|nr:hypothetical protein [Streptomyces umbrinus]MCR3728687.1 hypothetical protein [Streptomyces umbrinus]MCX4556723.1 hypothetical protein [Streptomyces phaeochromogenes]GHH47645.1 hypothetical protein GCM10018775_40710 [Streptomyces umbrinus]
MHNLTPNEQRHAESLEEIRSSPFLQADCGNADHLGPAPEELLPLGRYNDAWADVELDQNLLDCALRFTDLGAQWRTSRKKLPRIQGDFNLLHLRDVLNQPEGPAPTIPDATDSQLRFLSELRFFDHTPRSGSGKLAYIRLWPGGTPLEIWYSAVADIGGDPYPPGFIKMDITYCQYLDALLLTKGTYGWQYLYTDISLRRGDFRETVAYLQGMLEVFPEIFPQHDYTDLRERLEARQ